MATAVEGVINTPLIEKKKKKDDSSKEEISSIDKKLEKLVEVARDKKKKDPIYNLLNNRLFTGSASLYRLIKQSSASPSEKQEMTKLVNQAYKDVVKNKVLTKMKDSLASMKDGLKKLGKSAGNFLLKLLLFVLALAIIDPKGKILKSLINVFINLAKTFINTIIPLLPGIISAMIELITDILPKLLKLIVHEIIPAIGKAFIAAGNNLLGSKDPKLQGWGKLFKKIGEFLSSPKLIEFLDSLIDNLDKLIPALLGLVLLGKLVGPLETMIGIAKAAYLALSFLGRGIKSVAIFIGNFFKTTFIKWLTKLPTWLLRIFSIVTKIGAFIFSKILGPLSIALTIIAAIGGIFKLLSKFTDDPFWKAFFNEIGDMFLDIFFRSNRLCKKND